MGAAPPTDLPSPPNVPQVPGAPQLPSEAEAPDVGFPPVPAGAAGLASICKFLPPFLHFKFGFIKLPFKFPPEIPGLPRVALGINCSLSNPLDVTTTTPAGGGRKPNAPPNPDDVPGA